MRIALMCRRPDLYSHRRLAEAGEARGHEVVAINHMRCHIDIAGPRPTLHYLGAPLEGVDAVIPRIGASVAFFGTAVLRQFEMMDVHVLNESVAVARARDKLRASQLLSRAGVGLPPTVFAHHSTDPAELLALIGGAPAVIKLIEGAQGKGVVLGETAKAAESIIQAFSGLRAEFIVQKFIAEAKGEDIRCIVLDGKAIAAIRRRGAEGDFRSNLHQGGTAEPVRISPPERATAVAAAKAIGLNFCGVDMLRSAAGPVVLEVNASPGLEGVETAARVDVAAAVIAHLERAADAAPTAPRAKGRG